MRRLSPRQRIHHDNMFDIQALGKCVHDVQEHAVHQEGYFFFPIIIIVVVMVIVIICIVCREEEVVIQ